MVSYMQIQFTIISYLFNKIINERINLFILFWIYTFLFVFKLLGTVPVITWTYQLFLWREVLTFLNSSNSKKFSALTAP